MPDLNNLLNKYPGNKEVYESLKSLLTEGSAIAFVGAGASVPLYPVWRQLIEQLSDKAIQLGLAYQNDKKYWLRNIESQPLEMVSLIREKLGVPHYREFLRETFGPKTGRDGKSYTPTHAALMRMNFKAYITTNYDQGLLDAHQEIYTGIRDTGFSVWNQETRIKEWLSGDIFHEVSQPPILFAHGYHADPENIILDDKSYEKAYNNDTPYHHLIKTLWFQAHLVFVGFGFADITLKQIAKKILSQTAIGPRHFAFVGLSDKESYSPDMRRNFLETYYTEIILYPVSQTNQGLPDHSDLHLLLQDLSHEQASPWVSYTSAESQPRDQGRQNNSSSAKKTTNETDDPPVGGQEPLTTETEKREAITKYAEQIFGLMCEGRFGPEMMRSTDSVTLKEWQNGLKEGWKEAQWLMGLCYRFGIGVIAKLDKAAELFEQAAEQDYAPASLCLDFDRQLADSIYRASNEGKRSFTLKDVRAIALRSPWPGPSYKDDNMEILSCTRIAEKIKDRAASGHYFETTSGQWFVVDCPTNPEFLGVECSIRKYSV